MIRTLRTFALLSIFALLLSASAQGQSLRYGTGLQVMGGTAVASVSPGFHFRTTLPITQDLSLGGGIGLAGFVFEGQADAVYAVDPEVSLIVTIPTPSRSATYLLGGGGYHVPFGNDPPASGPSFHLGLGRIWALQETTLFLEFTPALYVRDSSAGGLFPIRAGVIF
ncbi:hypothetical protein GGP80_002921 [Salinibacter ruber]|jgi:hypothetical protein|uniref:Outer membrane protein beta-barrel domain-containing protein n=1 Tax=Salinibacter ruber TaxID=146919 RepID=A0AAW5PCI1_9BACT|nr:hypothetical protein [Salinibacter ruber]MBB4062771.1 hypothetical protein [Salinibacter ruber]MCS3640629.1 hypothetical protein [Salinibacter ruber]MCS3642819.1 hypothetical protein [Salinibacter ruber]MCS3650006.1 hypothetical protein [Salinibacter ruber]MCS3653259.1 hypothetical protein [Salinibacter ruber]